jgi:hypothetical protein
MEHVPFKFGEVVTGKLFTNREEEIKKLQQNFLSTQNTIIISPRRYGKSSLVKEAARRFRDSEKEYIFCFLDLMNVYSEEEFYNTFATKILKAGSTKVEELLQSAKNFIKGARITINAGTGEPAVEFGLNYIRDNVESILNLPQLLTERKKKKYIICIDEFQNISRFEGHQKLQGRLRSIWQHHVNTGYVLYGSNQSLMTDFFHETNMPFYRFGEIIYLNRIKAEKLKKFLTDTFSSSDKELPSDICDKVVEIVENHPYYLQQFARNIWLLSGKKVNHSIFDEALKALVAENTNFYNEILENLTNYQVSFLKALLKKETKLYSSHVINNYKLGSSANVKRLYNAFLDKGIIVKENGKIIFTDPIFALIAEKRLINNQ